MASDLRVLYLNTSTGWGGMEMHPLDLAQELARRGALVVFGLRGGSPMARSARGRGLACLALPFRWYLDPATLGRLRRAVRSFRIDVVHVHASRDAWRGLLLARLPGSRAVLVFSRHLASPAGRRKDDPLHRLLAERLDAMVAISRYIRENILAAYPVEPAKVRMIPYGLGDGGRGAPGSGLAVRKALGLAEATPLVGLVAQLTPDKRQDLLLEAASLVVKREPRCVFVLAGAPVQPAYERELRERVVALGLTGNVHLTGFWPDVPSLMQALDVLVMPSRAEAFGLVLLEAMANGRPIVGSGSGAVPEIVRHGENGVLFEPGNPAALAEALLWLLSDPERRRRMGLRGQVLFEERYRLEKEAAETEALYRELLGRRDAPLVQGRGSGCRSRLRW